MPYSFWAIPDFQTASAHEPITFNSSLTSVWTIPFSHYSIGPASKTYPHVHWSFLPLYSRLIRAKQRWFHPAYDHMPCPNFAGRHNLGTKIRRFNNNKKLKRIQLKLFTLLPVDFLQIWWQMHPEQKQNSWMYKQKGMNVFNSRWSAPSSPMHIWYTSSQIRIWSYKLISWYVLCHINTSSLLVRYIVLK